MRPNQADLIRLRPCLPLLLRTIRIVAGVGIVGSLLMIVLAVTIPNFVKNVSKEVWQDLGAILFMAILLGNARVIEQLSRSTNFRT